MNLQELNLNKSYISYGNDGIAKSLINPCLKVANTYKRSVGFFSSGVIGTILDGLVTFVRNGGKIKLVTSQQLNANDIEAIKIGYLRRNDVIENSFLITFEQEVERLDDTNLEILTDIISNGIMDVKVAVTKGLGIYHDKLGIIEDLKGNRLAFFGSSNSTEYGYTHNYEKVRIARSWIESEVPTVEDEVNEFDRLWDGVNPYVDVYDFQDAIKKCVLKITDERKINKRKKTVELRTYQEEAIAAWVANDYRGFFVMATGTGKTWTAIYAAHALQQHNKTIIVICAPYKHLVQQWYDDVKKVFTESRIIKVSSENPTWEQEIKEEIIRANHYPETQIVIISTIMSFNKDRFEKILATSPSERLLIVDEAHRFTMRQDWIHEKYRYLLGLSATPFTGINTAIGDELMSWFGGRVFNLPIEYALDKGYLVSYSYHPLFVSATEEEEESFNYVSRRMAACFNQHGVIVDVDEFIKLKRRQLRIISMSEEKISQLSQIISEIPDKDHFICYCGDGCLFDNEGNEIRHIQYVKKILDENGYRPAQFTASENMLKRMDIVDRFNSGDLTALAAIRCLDEGINIPSIKAALILSSNDSIREFVQRRGRILRTYKDKKSASIYDVIVLPSTSTPKMAMIEYRRYYEYARLASNSEELLSDFEVQLGKFGIMIEQIIGESSPDVEELDE